MAKSRTSKTDAEMAEWPKFAEIYEEILKTKPDPKMMDDWQYYLWFRRGQSNAGHIYRSGRVTRI